MPLPTAANWLNTLRDNQIAVRGDDINFEIWQTLKIIGRTGGFGRYIALGILHKLLANGYSRGGVFQNGAPQHIAPLIPELMGELRATALFVGQNEYATIGPRENNCPYIYSTGFFRCVGVVLFDGASQIATLGHVAPLTEAQMSVDRIQQDFIDAGGDLRSAQTVAYLFGGRDDETGNNKRRGLTGALGKITATVRHVPLTELGIDNNWGFHFNRATGAYAAVHGDPIELMVFGEPELCLMSQQRSSSNTSNDNQREKAKLLRATR